MMYECKCKLIMSVHNLTKIKCKDCGEYWRLVG